MKSELLDNYHPAFDDEKSLSYGCPKDDPRYTAEFFLELTGRHIEEISVLRFKKNPNSRFTKFAFHKLAAYYYLHDNNPRKDDIIHLAEKSMKENYPLRISIYGEFIIDINPVEMSPNE